MPYSFHPPRCSTALTAVAVLVATSWPEACANEVKQVFEFVEQPVEFRNESIKLAGSLLLPRREEALAAVVFVHGAGRHTRDSLREVAEHFASRGIAALICDKRGVGRSEGTYESHSRYKNLVDDALSAVSYLKGREEIANSQIGIWGLSQGAYISAAAASRTDDIRFIVAVGASVADGTMFYYRDNLFRLYGLSDGLRDVAEKAHLGKYSLPHNLEEGFGLDAFAPRRYPPPDQYVHPEWSRVRQPVLVMWGQLDQNLPVGESIAGMKNSLSIAKNDRWTMFVVPKANHDLGASETGALQSKWLGYAPGVLDTMTEWVLRALDDPSQLAIKRQVGSAQEKGVVPKLARYEGLRWYGNGIVQAVLWVLFAIVFLTNTLASSRHCLSRLLRGQQSPSSQDEEKMMVFKRALCALNLVILISFTYLIFLVLDQLRPTCPSALLYLPLLGSMSAVATVVLLVQVARLRSVFLQPDGSRFLWTLDTLCLVLFVPFMLYWNLLGVCF